MIKCIAVDDEPLALEQLTGYIARQLLERQGLVINSNAFDHNNGIISKTLKLSSRSLIDKV